MAFSWENKKIFKFCGTLSRNIRHTFDMQKWVIRLGTHKKFHDAILGTIRKLIYFIYNLSCYLAWHTY